MQARFPARDKKKIGTLDSVLKPTAPLEVQTQLDDDQNKFGKKGFFSISFMSGYYFIRSYFVQIPESEPTISLLLYCCSPTTVINVVGKSAPGCWYPIKGNITKVIETQTC